MSQLSLNLSTRLSYAPENFVLHAGVRAYLDQTLSLLTGDSFSIAFFTAPAGYGKTHFSIKLGDLVSQAGLFPRIVEGGEFAAWIDDHLAGENLEEDEVVIVDDAHDYFSLIEPGGSGPFVNLIEVLRQKRAGIVFFSALALDELPCDEHVKSRLHPGLGFCIDRPAEADLLSLVDALAKQRGMSLSQKKISFLARRVGRDLPAIEKYLNRVSHLAQVLGKPLKFKLLGDAV